jgi:hypothetical protein
MKRYIITICLLFFASTSFGQQVWTDHMRLLPDQLRNIPTGIFLYHNPSPVYPEQNTDTLNYPGKYVWKHSTFATAQPDDLEVVAAGSYLWYGEKGWITNVKLSRDDVAKKFNCPGGILKKGIQYQYVRNYRFGDKIFAGDALWFIIAKDKAGRLYKGFALVETEATLKNQH